MEGTAELLCSRTDTRERDFCQRQKQMWTLVWRLFWNNLPSQVWSGNTMDVAPLASLSQGTQSTAWEKKKDFQANFPISRSSLKALMQNSALVPGDSDKLAIVTMILFPSYCLRCFEEPVIHYFLHPNHFRKGMRLVSIAWVFCTDTQGRKLYSTSGLEISSLTLSLTFFLSCLFFCSGVDPFLSAHSHLIQRTSWSLCFWKGPCSVFQ